MKYPKGLNLLSLLPLLHVGGFLVLLEVCEAKFGKPIMDAGIDPKDTGYGFFIYLLHLLMLLCFLLMVFYSVLGVIGLMKKNKTLLIASGLYGMAFAVFLLHLLYHPAMLWFFD